MDQQATSALPQRRGLPSIPDYLHAVGALGLGSIRNALPAIAFLYFYRLGMGLYLAFSVSNESPFGLPEAQARIASVLAISATYLPLLVLVYTPFLPLQDAILRGQRRSFWDSVRHVLERLWYFVVSVVAQVALVLGPPAILVGALAVWVRTLPPRPDELVHLLALAAFVPCLAWIMLAALFLLFATPAVVLDDRGPIRSIRESVRHVAEHLGGILGRLFVAGLLVMLAAIAASLPDAILEAASSAAGYDNPVLRIARAVWESAVSALLFPFTVAALTVLYRAVVPAAGAAGLVAGTPTTPSEAAPRPATSPFTFE
jgi:hypothetical protein